jgi:flavin-dependent dehydrogenase
MKSPNKVATFVDEHSLPGLVYVFFVGDLLIAHYLCEPEPAGPRGPKPMELFERFLRNSPVVADVLKGAGVPHVSVGYKNVPTWNQVCSYRNVMFVGDAAPFVDPLSGEALYYAFKSGELAANVANRALRDDTVLAADEYEPAWQREFKQDIAYATLSHRLFSKRWVVGPLTKRLGKSRTLTETYVGAFLGNLPKKTLYRMGDLLELCMIRP